ncbi:hypothetical protein DDB_G0277259 [Dictyostelium discoideum AX4]|uniref:Ribosomal protein mS38 C-terminal domain-containing protein n=1 Tax=Dictyostelium discoideum TaxID=44689 RepID=Q86K38_DICDI|nr:hypothetical protein DDB_G0277259 [Dictyostelium discoideum AX4]EAL68815.1 hypothetical protein DDB_G0277259 [Dictyostelium discoideum AX4]|eukprot:XP_642766.1 hypothetical protein DDB_G0277259 [Dictyostelium discoideum AX4]
MFKNILKSNSLLRQYSIVKNNRSFSNLSNGSSSNSFSNLINKQYRFNLDGSLKSINTLNIKNILSNETEIKPILLIKDLNLNEINNNNNNNINKKQEQEALEVSSVVIKRRKMMSKHKQRKLRKRTRALKKRLGKI